MGTLWVWHFPALYNLTLETEWVHAVEHICFVASATIFWSAILDPIEAFRLKTGSAIVYLLSGGFAMSLLAILLTFAPAGLYPYYSNPEDPFGALQLIRQVWGISPTMDQQMGGALMWVMGSVIFLLAILVVLARWFRKPEKDLWIQGARESN